MENRMRIANQLFEITENEKKSGTDDSDVFHAFLGHLGYLMCLTNDPVLALVYAVSRLEECVNEGTKMLNKMIEENKNGTK